MKAIHRLPDLRILVNPTSFRSSRFLRLLTAICAGALGGLGLVERLEAQVRLPAGNPSLGGAGAGMSASPTVRGEKLVPAAMNVITDKQGNSWNLEQNGNLGRVGNSMVNSGLTLLLNNQQFYTYQPMMTADGLLHLNMGSLPMFFWPRGKNWM